MTRNKLFQIAIPLAVLFALLVLVMPRNAKLGYDYRRGQPWKYETLIAPFDFPILKTDGEILDELARRSTPTVPYYRYSAEIENKNLRAVEGLDLPGSEGLRSSIVSAMNDIFEKGVVGDDGVVSVEGADASEIIYVQRGKRATSRPATEVYKLSEARLALLAAVSSANPGVNVDSLLRSNGVYDFITPNLIYDRQISELVQAETSKTVSPTVGFVSAGQLIVSRGEIVTPEIEQMLDSYKKEYENSMGSTGPEFLYWLGNIILALALVALLFLAILFSNRELFRNRSAYLYLILIVTVTMLAAIIVPRVESGLIYLVPFTLCVLLLEPFFDDRLIYMVYTVALLPLLLYSESVVVVFSIFLVAGIVSIYTFRHFNKGWLQFANALIVYAVMMLVYMGFRLTDVTGGGMLRISVYLFAAAMLPVAGYPLTYLFERIFNLVSPFRLSELADTSNVILQELEAKAPGTFQHSLQVMNMTDACARAIGADVQLVRVGALYHDIGKMQNPLCFVENESLVKNTAPRYHADLTPLQSAQDVIRHVQDGVEIAEKHHLPGVVIDFIKTHQGTAHTGFFYTQYLNDGGDPANASAFQYPGPRPRTREQVILMLCDSIEAASRTLKEYSPKAFDEFVEKIVEVKTADGQFDNAEITIKDMGKIKEVLKNYLSQMYHERIAYPNRKK